MEKLKAALQFGGMLTEENIAHALRHTRHRKLKAGDHLLQMGKCATDIAFVEQGVLRVYGIDDLGTEVTKYFVRPNQFTTDLESYYTGSPSQNPIQAVLDTDLYIISKTANERLCAEIPNYFVFLKTLTEAQLLNKIKDNDFLNFGGAKTKYLEFLKRYPDLALQVPQVFIASYLKITPQSLSRIRREIAGH